MSELGSDINENISKALAARRRNSAVKESVLNYSEPTSASADEPYRGGGLMSGSTDETKKSLKQRQDRQTKEVYPATEP